MIEIEDIKRISLDKDDVVLVEFDHTIDSQTHQYLNTLLKKTFPNNESLIMSKGVRMSVMSFGDRWCHHCHEKIGREAQSFSMRSKDKKLEFHKECFQEIAGQRFMDLL